MATPNIVPRAAGEGGLGTAAKGWGGTFVTNTTTSSATQGGKLVLAADDGAVMADNHRLGVIEFSGAEDTGNTISIGARIQAICRDAWDGSNNDADLEFYTTDGTTESKALTLDADSLATFAGAARVNGATGISVIDSTTSSATEGGNLVLASDDGAVMGSGHRLGVIEFKGAEDTGNTLTVGARIESITKAAWDASNNDAKLSFYSSYDNAQQSEKVDIGGNTAMSVYHDYHTTTFENQLSDDEGGGTILKYSPGADESPAGSELFFLHTDGTWNQTDADAVATGGSQLLAVGLGASARTTGVLLEGFVRIASTEILNTPGSGAVDGLPLYVSTTAGHFDFTAPSGTGDFVRIVGYAIDDDSSDVLVYFKPDSTFVEL